MSKLGKKLIAAVTQKDIVSTEFPRATRLTRELEETKRDIKWLEKELAANPGHETNMYLTNPVHGGKVCCHKCSGFIIEGDEIGYHCYQNAREFPAAHFHKSCYNEYEHYYGLDKPID